MSIIQHTEVEQTAISFKYRMDKISQLKLSGILDVKINSNFSRYDRKLMSGKIVSSNTTWDIIVYEMVTGRTVIFLTPEKPQNDNVIEELENYIINLFIDIGVPPKNISVGHKHIH